jgi:hypothetical protein
VIIQTCSYSAWAPSSGAAPVVVSLTTPKWLPEAAAWPKVRRLTPQWTDFRTADWDERYLARLERFGVASIRDRLHNLGRELGAERLVLLCWELSGHPGQCHRGVYARWWMEKTGEVIDEYPGQEVMPT